MDKYTPFVCWNSSCYCDRLLEIYSHAWSKAQRVSSPLAPSPSLPTHHEVSQARAFICCAHYSFLPLFGICTCIVQFCWQNSSSHF